jgi:tetratricopeptide (TPR) repeat protein
MPGTLSKSIALLAAILALVWISDVRSAEENASRVGKLVVLKSDGIRIGHSDESGQPVHVAELTDIVYRVLNETNDWLRVRHCGAEDWFAKDSAVLLDDAIPYFTDRIRANPRDAVAFAHRGRVRQEKGELDQALRDYDEAIRLATTEVDEPRFGPLGLRQFFGRRVMSYPPQASWFRGRAKIYARKGETDKAISEYVEALRTNPAEPLTYVDRGITYKGLKDYQKALADYGEAIRLDPRWAAAYFNRANVFKTLKEYDKAIDDYGAAIRLDPQDPDAYFNRGNTYLAIKQYARAARDWGDVVRLDQEDADTRERLGWLLATCPDEAVRDGQRAVDLAGDACDLTDGKSARCLATLAAAFAETGRFDLARKWQSRALESSDYERDEGPAARQRLRLYENGKPFHDE